MRAGWSGLRALDAALTDPYLLLGFVDGNHEDFDGCCPGPSPPSGSGICADALCWGQMRCLVNANPHRLRRGGWRSLDRQSSAGTRAVVVATGGHYPGSVELLVGGESGHGRQGVPGEGCSG